MPAFLQVEFMLNTSKESDKNLREDVRIRRRRGSSTNRAQEEEDERED
jgi:hypothetical protein